MQFRNVSDTPQDLPSLGDEGLRVLPGETFEATGDAAKGLQGNPSFERADRPSKTTEKES